MAQNNSQRLLSIAQSIAAAKTAGLERMQERGKRKEDIANLGFLLKETDPLFLSSPAAKLTLQDLAYLRTIHRSLDTITKMQGPKGDTPIAGKDFPLPKDGRSPTIHRGKTPPSNPFPGDLWIRD